MIDYNKVNNLPVPVEKILSHEQLTFPLSNVATTGEMLHRAQVAHFGKMDVVVKGGYVKLKGSYQKHDQGGTNYRDFTFPDIQRVIGELVSTFQFDPKDAYYNFIEIGVNIEVLSDPIYLIKNFLRYRHKEFETLPVTGAGYGRQCRLQQFTIKVYNKSLQYGLPFHLLRFEVKVTRMEFLKQYGIKNLTMFDLSRPDVYSLFLKMLLDVFNQILFFNPDINIDSIKNLKDRDLVLQGKFPEYWMELPRQRRSEQIKRFTELTGTNIIKKELAELISDKWSKLMNPDKITTFQTLQKDTIPDKLTTFKKEHLIETNEEFGRINTTIKSYCNVCPITKVDISMQKSGSKFLCVSGIRWLFETDQIAFNELRLKRLSDKWYNEPFEIQIREIAHSIRNEYNNPRHNATRDIKNLYSYPVLFDLVPFIRLDKMNVSGLCLKMQSSF